MKHDTSLSFFNTLLIQLLPGIGTQRYWSLMRYCQSGQHILTSDPKSLPHISEKAQQLLRQYQQSPLDNPLVERAHHIIDRVNTIGASIISEACPTYPHLLHNIHTPSPLLFVRGTVAILSLPQLAIVGSRHATHQGLSTARMFAEHLASCGFTITSGLALGVDSAAHQGVIDAHQQQSVAGNTVAVMATGIDQIYPRQHHRLAEQILDIGGALITEFLPDTPPKQGIFQGATV